jgi:hypothetical protein
VNRQRLLIALAVAAAATVPLAPARAAQPADSLAAATGHGAGVSHRRSPGLTAGTTGGYVYVEGPADLVAPLCSTGVEDGVVCDFSGRDKAGTGADIITGNNEGNGSATFCVNSPLPTVDNVDNDTNTPLTLADGTCAKPGATVQVDQPGTDSNNQPADAHHMYTRAA